MKHILLLAFCSIWLAVASANSYLPRYSDLVRIVDWHSQANWQHTVYIWPWVKTPGAYPYKKGMTLADLVTAAGGFVKDEREKEYPAMYNFPERIEVTRPSAKDPDPDQPVFKSILDWSKTNGGISDSKFELQEGDFVGVSMR